MGRNPIQIIGIEAFIFIRLKLNEYKCLKIFCNQYATKNEFTNI